MRIGFNNIQDDIAMLKVHHGSIEQLGKFVVYSVGVTLASKYCSLQARTVHC